MATREVTSAGTMVDRQIVPRYSSAAKRPPANGTLYTAPTPAPAPQAINTLRCSGGSRTRRASQAPAAAAACWAAASRPIEAPMPTETSEMAPLTRVGRGATSPVRIHTARVGSPPVPPATLRSVNSATPVTSPPSASTATRRRSLRRPAAAE